ncbi:Bifunctional DNA primase/polymerase, N-terminal [Streptomyces sp. DvalAA-14]|uniref:bifunctional DNA primase/polymerase n=1 Tax=unclassified Streptomyces TaxID=2593676 RepID=UPI00081B9721|nr:MULTISPECIES: bifunctional DNA primase/polymerase [unclassified Streptomyces]MYS22565.1 DNA primase [Streptomyces sp. SID4948]SCE18502.1 Bifunctional DNA primase/polymerase, N-terminal [Streptomyces sp. DvalAA-14]
MREILGRRRKVSLQRKGRTALLNAVLTYAEQWKWRVVPGVGYDRRGTWRAAGEQTCACPRPNCPVPGAHPLDPGLLAATHDPRMVRWWWNSRPEAPVILATGEQVSAASLPARAGELAVTAMEKLGVRLGPVIATPTRYVFLVAPYSLAELGELLDSQDWVPTSLRYHGDGGYVPLPAAGGSGAGQPRWVREPVAGAGEGSPWLPGIGTLVDALVRAGRTAPDGDRLTY